MGKGTEQSFLQRGHGQQTYKKKLNITNLQGNLNRNLNEISPHICEDGCYPKELFLNCRYWQGVKNCCTLW